MNTPRRTGRRRLGTTGPRRTHDMTTGRDGVTVPYLPASSFAWTELTGRMSRVLVTFARTSRLRRPNASAGAVGAVTRGSKLRQTHCRMQATKPRLRCQAIRI